MSFGVVVCRNSVNLGDEIQSLAAIRLLKQAKIDPVVYLDRDTGDVYKYPSTLKNLSTEKNEMKVDLDQPYYIIYNGWTDGNYCRLPSSSYIRPLVISLHVNETVKDTSYDWLEPFQKKFISLTDPRYRGFYGSDPIGCRDEHTYQKFLSVGYENAYVSGCLTMTLSATPPQKREGIYLVDVNKSKMSRYLPSEILQKVITVSHVFTGDCTNETQKYDDAEKLLELYQKAELVITSRLHCALPCLAYGTPVLFAYENMEDVRLRGLIDTIPVIGRDEIDYHNVINVLPNEWKSRVRCMKKVVNEWIKKITDDDGVKDITPHVE